jgi:hypothetical protein
MPCEGTLLERQGLQQSDPKSRSLSENDSFDAPKECYRYSTTNYLGFVDSILINPEWSTSKKNGSIKSKLMFLISITIREIAYFIGMPWREYRRLLGEFSQD